MLNLGEKILFQWKFRQQKKVGEIDLDNVTFPGYQSTPLPWKVSVFPSVGWPLAGLNFFLLFLPCYNSHS